MEDFNLKTFTEFMANKEAHDFDVRLGQFRAWCQGKGLKPSDAEEIVRRAGYPGIREFCSDSRTNKWAKLRVPGQGNYADQE